MNQAEARFQQFEREGWEEVAGTYAELSDGLTSEVAAPLLDAAEVGAGCRVLDVATGPGWIAGAAAARGADAVGLDMAEAMLEQARRRFPTLSFHAGSAEALGLPDASFDAVVSAFGMPHFADHAAFAREAFRVLRPGGRIAFASWYPPAQNPFFGLAVGAIATHGSLDVPLPEGVDMFRWADQAACDTLLSGAGFGPATRRDAPLSFDTDGGGAAVVDFLRKASVRTRALYQAQSDTAREAIRGAIDRGMEPFREGARWRIPLCAFVVAATKL